MKKTISLLLVLIMVLGMFPMSAMASGGGKVYASVSYDGAYLDLTNGSMAYREVPISDLSAIDLAEYGLSDYLYDENGDGTYEVTALHLLIYTHETLMGLEWSNVTVEGSAGSIFFSAGLFDFDDCNLQYYLNGDYPAIEGWGLTADQIVLKDGDFIDVAGYSSWNFYSDSAFGFHYFLDNDEITHEYAATAGEALTVTLGRGASYMGSGSTVTEVANYTVSYGTAFGTATGTVTTNTDGQAEITFAEAGTYYLWVNGGYGVENPLDIVSAPGCAKVTVTEPACTHESWNAATCTTPKTCAACGETEDEADPAAHNYVDGACKYCNAAEPVTTYTVTLPTETTGYTVSAAEGSVSPVAAGGSYSFTITIADGYEAGENFAVKANDTMLTAAADVYTIENITTNQTITVDGVVERIEDTVIYTGSDWPASNYYIESLTLGGVEVDYVDGFDVYLNHKTAQDSAFTLTAAAGGRNSGNLGVNWNDGDTNTKTYTTNLVNGEAIVKIYAYKASGAGASRSGTKTFYFHIVAPNARPTLVVGQDAAVNVTKTVGETFEVDLNTIFTDDDGNEMTYQVKLNDGSWTNLEGSEYHFTPEFARNYALAFRAYDGFVYSKDTYTVNLTANNSSETYTVTVSAPEDVLFYCTAEFTGSVDVLGANIESEYKEGIYTLSVPANINRISWRMSDIGMSAVVEEDATLTLIEANFKVMAGEAEDTGALTVKYGDYTAVGSENSYLLLAGEKYSYVVTPADALYSTYNESGKTPIAGENVIELTLKHITVIAPEGSTVSSGRFYSYFRYDFNEAQKITELEDGRLSVDFPVPGYESFIRVQHPDGVTYWDFEGNGFSDGTTLEVTADMLFIGNDEYTKDTVYANFEKNSKDKADLYLTVNAQGWLDMDTGDTHSLNVFRNWIPVANSISNNGVSLPDVTYTVVDVNGNPSDVVTVTPDANNSCYADITAAKAGTAIILVSYDAVYNADGEGGKQFSAIWPENTGVIVVTVDADDADIQTNITVNETANAGGKQILDVEHDILFYVGDAGAEYSFKPEDGCTVTISRSTVGNEMTFNGFTNEGVTVSEDGTVTLSGLTTGAHVVKVEKDGKAAYQVIRAREVSYKLTHSDGTEVTAENPAQPGETITVQFSKLIDPLAKLSGVYNANFGFYYNGEDGAAVRTSGGTYGVYNFSSNSGAQRFTVTVPAEWDSATYTLTDGGIKLGGFGSSFGAHRSTTYMTGKEVNTNASGTAGVASVLPDVVIPVYVESTLATYTVTLPTGTTYTVIATEGSTSPVVEGGNYSFTVTIVDGWEAGENFAVKANDTKLTAVEGVYTIENITADQTVTVEGVEVIPTYTVTLPTETTGYTVTATEGSTSPVTKGGSYSFTVAITDGYEASENFAVKANDTKLTAVEGIYTIENITADQTITVEGVEVIPIYTVTLPTETTDYTVTATENSASPVTKGGSYSFTVTIADGYEASENFAVKANDVELTDVEGVYTISNITADQTVTVEGVVEKQEEPALTWQEVMAMTQTYLTEQAENTAPIVGTNKGEWMVLGLARNGMNADNDIFKGYYDNVVRFVEEEIDAETGRLDKNQATVNARVILGLTSIGRDVTNVAGHNLLKGLSDTDFVKKQGINGPVWALIALDSHDYEIPTNADSSKQVTREWLIDYILDNQLEGGGWKISGTSPDDMTPMAVQALAPYYNSNDKVKVAIDKALTIMEGMVENASPETLAQIIVARSTMGLYNEEIVNKMLAFALEDGSFKKSPSATNANQMSTEQAFYAMVAYSRFLSKKTALYDMSDVVIEQPAEQDKPVESVTLSSSTLSMKVGETDTLVALVSPADATNRTVSWSSSNTGVATVSSNGVVTAVAEGSAIITAIAGEKSASCTVTVTKESSSEPKLEFGLTKDEIIGYVTISFEDNATRKSAELSEIESEFRSPLGTIIRSTRVPFKEGDTIASVTLRLLNEKEFTASYEGDEYGSFYLEAIGNFTAKGHYYSSFGEFDAGRDSGWMITWNGWFIDQGASEFEVKNGDVVRWQYTCQLGADIGDVDWSDDNPSTTPNNKDDEVKVPISSDKSTIHVDATVDGSKVTVDEVDFSNLNTVIDNHVETGTVTIDFSALDSDKPITTVEIPAAAVKQIAEAVNDPANDAHSLEIVLSDGVSIEFDAAALKEKASQANGADITISIEHHENAALTNAQKDTVGNRPAFDINVTSGGKHISDMGGKITIHAPYELKSGEKARGILVWYVDDHGNKERCVTSYDPIKKRVNWKTDHLSLYMIDYDETLANNPFTDVTMDNYYFDAVLWAVDEGITNGTSDTTFSPDASCTRAQMVTFLWRAAGSPKATVTTCTFADVDKDAYYYEALLWAVENGITNGTSDTTFSPDASCTRGQMATFLYRNAKTPSVSGSHDFTDVKADAYYNDAVIWAADQKITNGTSDTTFSPDADCTRGQMVTFLYRYLAE